MTWEILELLVLQTKLCRTLGQSSLKTIDQDCSKTIRAVGSLSCIIYAHVILQFLFYIIMLKQMVTSFSLWRSVCMGFVVVAVVLQQAFLSSHNKTNKMH